MSKLLALVVVVAALLMGQFFFRTYKPEPAPAVPQAIRPADGVSVSTPPPGAKVDEPAAVQAVAQEARFERALLVVTAVKRRMANPGSFELVSIGMTPEGTACVVYRGTNPEGVALTEQVAYTEAWERFDWKPHCVGKPIEDMTAKVKAGAAS